MIIWKPSDIEPTIKKITDQADKLRISISKNLCFLTEEYKEQLTKTLNIDVTYFNNYLEIWKFIWNIIPINIFVSRQLKLLSQADKLIKLTKQSYEGCTQMTDILSMSSDKIQEYCTKKEIDYLDEDLLFVKTREKHLEELDIDLRWYFSELGDWVLDRDLLQKQIDKITVDLGNVCELFDIEYEYTNNLTQATEEEDTNNLTKAINKKIKKSIEEDINEEINSNKPKVHELNWRSRMMQW